MCCAAAVWFVHTVISRRYYGIAYQYIYILPIRTSHIWARSKICGKTVADHLQNECKTNVFSIVSFMENPHLAWNEWHNGTENVHRHLNGPLARCRHNKHDIFISRWIAWNSTFPPAHASGATWFCLHRYLRQIMLTNIYTLKCSITVTKTGGKILRAHRNCHHLIIIVSNRNRPRESLLLLMLWWWIPFCLSHVCTRY